MANVIFDDYEIGAVYIDSDIDLDMVKKSHGNREAKDMGNR